MGTQINIGLDTVALVLAILGGLAALWRIASRRRSFVSGPGQVFISKPEVLRRQFFGRAQELSAIVEQLDSGKTVVVLGVAGIGKSSLGKAVAKMLDDPSKRLVWVRCTSDTDLRSFVDMFSLHVKTVYQETALREAYEKYEAHDAAQWVDLLAGYLSRHRYVFFVDDLHLVKDRVVLSELFPRLCTAANMLILTREMDLSATAAIQQVSVPAEIRLQGLADADAVELLRQMGLNQETKENLLKLARRLGGHPKALEICAGLVLDARLKVTVTELATGPVLEKDPEGRLEQALRFSDRRLSPAERGMMIACAAFFEPFTREAVLAVYWPPKNGVEILSKLESRCLVDEGDQGTLSLHPLVQEYYEGVGRRTYRALLMRVWVVSVTVNERLHQWLISFSPMNLLPMCAFVRTRFRIAKYLQALGIENLEARQRTVRYLVEADALDTIVEIEKIQYRADKHPFTLVLHSPIALLLTTYFVGLFNVVLLVFQSAGWPWIGWLIQQRLLSSALLAVLCATVWGYLEVRSLRKSYVVVTADHSLCMENWGGEWFFVETGLSWFAVPWPFVFQGHFGRYENPGEHVLLDPRRLRFRGREFGRLLLLRKKHPRKGTPLHISFGFIDRPEAQYQALMQALKPSNQAAEQAQPIGSDGSQGNEA